MTEIKSPILLEFQGDIAHVILNAPPKNEMDWAFFEAFGDMVAKLAAAPPQGVIVRGAGHHFSSGANVAELKGATARADSLGSAGAFFTNSMNFQKLFKLPCVVVAAISGCCLGSGLELALACHIRVATRRSVMGLPETTFGLIPGCGATARLSQCVGVGRAISLILSGRAILADEALDMGLVDHLVERKHLLATARQLVETFSRIPIE